MKKTFGKWFGLDVPLEEVYFNIAVAYLSIIFILMIMSGIYFGFERNFYYVIGLAGFVTAFCIGYVTQSHNYQRGTFAIAMILEVFYFPVSYIMEGRLQDPFSAYMRHSIKQADSICPTLITPLISSSRFLS